jgi:aminoglycoside phosphotransferase family enzyme
MAKIKNALFSLEASGSVAKLVNYQKQIGTQIARLHRATNKKPTIAQATQREAYRLQYTKWLSLTINEKQKYVTRAQNERITGLNLYLKETLKKSPTTPNANWDNGISSWDNGASLWQT